ncbi:hypothetical protein [Halomonas sp. PA16-9]|uniref:hypothetical protein n=1 Tax=Halomonas sp. PA16-9 TaxID=2576841 RepID=UPI0030EF8F2E
MLALLPALVIFCAFWLLPFSRLIMMGAEPDPSSGISAYLTILTHRQYLISLATTVGLSLVVSLVAVAIAGVAGFFLARQRFFGKSILVAILTFPLAFPGVVVGFLVIMLGDAKAPWRRPACGCLASVGCSLTHWPDSLLATSTSPFLVLLPR